MDGLRELPEIHGIDSWQALMLAKRTVKLLLRYFIEVRGKLYSEKGGDQLTLDDVFWEDDKTPPDEQLTDEQQKRVNGLSDEDLVALEAASLSNCAIQFRKVARIVGLVMGLDLFPDNRLPDIFYAQCVYRLVESGKLVHSGKLGYMHSCEVRLP